MCLHAKEAVREALSPISVPPKQAEVETCEGPGWIEIGSMGMSDGVPVCAWKDATTSPKRPKAPSTTPQELMLLHDSLNQQLNSGGPRKWSEESGSTAVPEDDKEIRPSLSNSSVSTMTSFEANRSRACSNGSISSYVDEFNNGEAVRFDMKIQEDPPHTLWYASSRDANHYETEKKWKAKPSYGYYKRWESNGSNASYWGQDSSSGESMVGSPFTTPIQSPKLQKEMMHGHLPAL